MSSLSFDKNRGADSKPVNRKEIIEKQIVVQSEFVEFRPFYTSSHVRSLIGHTRSIDRQTRGVGGGRRQKPTRRVREPRTATSPFGRTRVAGAPESSGAESRRRISLRRPVVSLRRDFRVPAADASSPKRGSEREAPVGGRRRRAGCSAAGTEMRGTACSRSMAGETL